MLTLASLLVSTSGQSINKLRLLGLVRMELHGFFLGSRGLTGWQQYHVLNSVGILDNVVGPPS